MSIRSNVLRPSIIVGDLINFVGRRRLHRSNRPIATPLPSGNKGVRTSEETPVTLAQEDCYSGSRASQFDHEYADADTVVAVATDVGHGVADWLGITD